MDVLTKASVTEEAGFAEIVGLIAAAQQRAFQAVNSTLIDLYWQVGEYISRKIEAAEWEMEWSRNWPSTSPGPSQANTALLPVTSFA